MAKRTEPASSNDNLAALRATLAPLRPYVLPVLGLTFVLLVAILALQRLDSFLAEDARFRLRSPDLGDRLSPDIRLGGASRADVPAIRAVFRPDEGQSVFRVPIEERRRRVEEIKWVRTATVSRVWPNRLDVRLEERTPVAFVQLSSLRRRGDQGARLSLIDSEGELLPVTPGLDSLPMLTGLREDHQTAARAARVRLMQRLLDDLGPIGKSISEVDVCREDNIRVVYPIDGRAVTLAMGNARYRARLERFVRYYPEIQKRMPGVVALDLRLEDRITADEVERQECDGQR